MTTTPIVLIHGLWLTPRSWEGWKSRFEQRGHEVLVPAWPRMEHEVDDGHDPCSAARRKPMAWATAARVAWVAASGVSIMKSCVMPS